MPEPTQEEREAYEAQYWQDFLKRNPYLDPDYQPTDPYDEMMMTNTRITHRNAQTRLTHGT